MYYPVEKNGKWYAERKIKRSVGSRPIKQLFKSSDNKPLEFDYEVDCKGWCDARNIIDKII